jgi:hypothetical protein
MTRRSAILLPRMRSAWPLLLSVLVSTLVAASLVAAFAGFSAAALPQAVSSELLSSPHRTVTVSGAIDANQDREDEAVVSASIRHAFGGIRYTSAGATWSDPIGLPALRGAKTVPLLQAAAMSQIKANVKLTEGTWPAGTVLAEAADAARRDPALVQAVAPASAASALRLSVGQVLTLRDRLTGAKVRFELTGLYRPLNQSAPYWNLDLISPSGASEQPGFITYGPFLVGNGAFGERGLAIGGASWLYQLGTTRLAASQLDPLSARIGSAVSYLSGSQRLGGLQAASELPVLLSGVATKLVVAKSLLLVGELELLLLVAAALTLTARTLASQREDESAVLGARGASRRQLFLLTLAEALLVTVLAAAAGAVLGGRLAGILAKTGALRSAGLRVGGISADDWWTAGAVFLLCTAVMVWPALSLTSPGQARARRGRRAAVAVAALTGADLALVVIAVLAGWQLRQFSVLGRTAGGLGVDPVLALAPAIALAAGTVLPLRLLPLLARAGDRLAARTRRVGAALTTWELSRRAARQSAPMLLVVLAVGTSTLALAQHQSWRQSTSDQGAFLAGADVRADTLFPATIQVSGRIARARGVQAAMAVSTGLAGPGNGEVLAVDARHGAAVALLRSDETAPGIWRDLAPAPAPHAITLPGRVVRVRITAAMAPGAGPGIGPVPVSLSVQDGAGVVYQVPAGTLPADGRPHQLVASLAPAGEAVYPLRLLAIMAGFELPPRPRQSAVAAAAARTATFSVTGLAASPAEKGAFTGRIEVAGALAAWTPGLNAEAFDESGVGNSPILLPGSNTGTVVFHPGDGISPSTGFVNSPSTPIPAVAILRSAVPSTEIPGVATAAFLRANNLETGSVVQVTAGQAPITVKIVASVGAFPTVTGPAGALIIDETAAQDLVAAQGLPPFGVTEWWLATRSGVVPSGLPPNTTVTSAAKIAGALSGDPMAVIPQQAIQATALAAALLAILGFSVSVAGSIRERRAQSAILAALGLAGRARARLLIFEALALSLPAAATGLLLGTVLAHLLVPAVTLTATAAAPAVPVLVRVPLNAVIGIALFVTAIPVVAAAVTIIYRPDPAAQLRASETA